MAEDREIALNAFAYWPLTVSRIRGLGGSEASPDPSYAFHSEYAELERGHKVARVALRDLRAEAGTLTVRVFRLEEGEPVPVTLAGEGTARLFNLMAGRRSLEVPFKADGRARYAVGGFVFDHTDAEAGGVEIAIAVRRRRAAQTPSRFGRRMARRVDLLTDGEPPRLAAPMSQGFSDAQLLEPAFAAWAEAVAGVVDPVERWEVAYPLQALKVYGRLEPEAWGLGLGRGADPVADAARRAGCAVAEVAVAAGETVGAALTRAAADAWPPGFDFLWSRSAVWRGVPEAELRAQLDALLEPLAPGGLAVHVLPLEPGGLDRHALNRTALGLVADGHLVAELRHGDGDAPVFGVIVRKADTPA